MHGNSGKWLRAGQKKIFGSAVIPPRRDYGPPQRGMKTGAGGSGLAGRLRERLVAWQAASTGVGAAGPITDHHRFLLRELMEDLEFVERKNRTIGTGHRLAVGSGEDRAALYDSWRRRDYRLDAAGRTRLGYARVSESQARGQLGGIVSCNHESGGKRLSSRTRKGNRWLRRALCQAAWAATRKKNCYPAAFFYRKAGKHGIRKAIVATAQSLASDRVLPLTRWHQISRNGGDYLLHPERTRNQLVRRLQRLGLDVSLQPKPDAPPPPPLPKRKRGRPCKCAERGSPCTHRHL